MSSLAAPTGPLVSAAPRALRRERRIRFCVNLLIFLSFFQNGLTILVNVKLRMIGFVILVLFFSKGLFIKGERLRAFEKAMLTWFGTGVLSGLFDFRFGLDGQVAYALVYNLISEFGWIMAYFAGRYAASQGVDFRRVMKWTLIFGLVLTAVAIVEKFTHEYLELYLLATSNNAFLLENYKTVFHRGYGFEESAYRCMSFVLEFIAFSYLCGVLALAFLIFFLEYRKLWYLIGLLTSIAALFLTQSLSSLAAFSVCALIYLLGIKRLKLANFIYLGLAGGIFLAAVSFQKDGPSPFEGIQGRLSGVFSGKDEGLLIHFHEFQYSVIDNFTVFGKGLGTADFLHGQLPRAVEEEKHTTVEHEYYRLIYEVGGVGFLIYLAALFFSVRESLRVFRAETDPWRKGAAALIVLWFLQNILVGFAHRSLPTYESSIFPALLFGYLCFTVAKPANPLGE